MVDETSSNIETKVITESHISQRRYQHSTNTELIEML